ncbi:EZH inhibitory protein-like [Mustela erminea]|uniref:EZH inhibitory protein-like n=1 Tax=Mustela erminea TaxID=36723 RepID=UPI0013875816|nr:EZH inhibitory protein-like [Mustela erminea]
MATLSSDEKARKQPQGEVPVGPKNKVPPAPGEAYGVSSPDPRASVPSVSSGLSPSGGGAPHSGTAGSSASALAAAVGAISINGEGPDLPSTARVQARERADLQGSRSPHAELRCVVPGAGQGLQASHAGGVGTVVQAMRGVGQASGPSTLPTSLGKGRGRKQLGRKETAQAQKPPGCRCLFPGLLAPQCPMPSPPSSPGPQPSGRRRSRASPWGQAAQPGPALRSQARAPGPALRSQAARPGPALSGCATPLGIDHLSRESEPGPARRRCRHAPEPGPARRRCRHAPEPGPVRPAPSTYTTPPRSPLGGQAARQGVGHGSYTAPPGPALHSHASGSGPALRSPARGSGQALHSNASAQGPAGRRRHCCRATAPGPALQSPTTRPGEALCCPAALPGLALSSPTSHPAPLRCSGASCRGPVLHNRATRPSLALEIHASPPGPTLCSSLTASPGPVLRSHASTLGPVLRSHVTQQRSAVRSLPSPPGLAAQSLSPPGFALRRLVFRSSSNSPDPEVLCFASQPGPAIHASSSSPSSLGAFSCLFPRRYSESFSSSSPGSLGLSPCPSPAGCSVLTSSSSSCVFCGLGSSSTPSPATIRRTLLPALDALSPVSPGERAEIGSTPYPPTPPML